MEVPVRELKNRLSEYLRLAQAGQEVVITSRGRPVARLVSVVGEMDDEADVVAELNALPWMRPGSGGRIEGSAAPMASIPGDRPLSEILLEDRE